MGHAILSCSGGHRWSICNPSALLEHANGDKMPGDSAIIGTVAHEISALKLWAHMILLRDDSPDEREEYAQQCEDDVENWKTHPLYKENEMGHVIEGYVNYAIELYNDAEMRAEKGVGIRYGIEDEVSLERWVEQGFGTSDFWVYGGRILDVLDLKTGRGKFVEVFDNVQMKMYALGVLERLQDLWIETIRMTIYQPLLDNVNTFTISKVDLLLWAENELKPAAYRAFRGLGELVVGEHCRFCKVAATCKAKVAHSLEHYDEFSQVSPHLINVEQAAEILDRIDDVKAWATSFKDYALHEALRGKKWPRWKLVQGDSKRKYASESGIIQALTALEYPREKFMESSLIGIGAMERLLGKKGVVEKLGNLIIKPPGAPTLVPYDDKRAEYSSAANDFAGIEIKED